MNHDRSRIFVANMLAGLAVIALLFTSSSVLADNPQEPLPQAQRFDGQRSYDYLKQICALGPRMSGSKGMAAQQELLVGHFRKLGLKVDLQRIPPLRHPFTGQTVQVANLIVQCRPEAKQRILLCAHYDTLPYPDRERNPRLKRSEFIGANDGGSGVAVLMEMAHHVQEFHPDLGLDFVFFDAEEFVFGSKGKYFVGSEFFAQNYVHKRPPYQYRAAVLLDMVGDRNLSIYFERHSISWPESRPLVKEIWGTAARLGVEEFQPVDKYPFPINDDHLALRNIARIPACDIIDYHFPDPKNSFWHTTKDTVANCSADSLGKVGWVLQEWLRSKEK